MFTLFYQKTEIAKSDCEPKWQGLRRRTGEARPRAENFGDFDND